MNRGELLNFFNQEVDITSHSSSFDWKFYIDVFSKTVSNESSSLRTLLQHNIQPNIIDASKKVKIVASLFSSVLCGAQEILEYKKPPIFDSVLEKIYENYRILGLWHPDHEEVINYVVSSPNYFKILISGLPGSGKTSLIDAICLSLPQYNGITYMNHKDFQGGINNSKVKDSIVVIEDIDLLVSKGRDGDTDSKQALHSVLTLLDNTDRVFITTNKPEELDVALTRRGRIDKVFNIDYIDKDNARVLIKHKLVSMLEEKLYRNYSMHLKGREKTLNDRMRSFVAQIDSLGWFEDLVIDSTPLVNNGYQPSSLSSRVREVLIELQSDHLRDLGVESLFNRQDLEATIPLLVEASNKTKALEFVKKMRQLAKTLHVLSVFIDKPEEKKIVEATNELKMSLGDEERVE